MKNQQSGFTLIELIIVIVILGILAAFALPRFADLSGDAKLATLNGAAGSMRSASAIAHSAYLVAGTGPNVKVTIEGEDVDMKNGYPSTTGILVAAQISSTDFKSAQGTGSVSVSPAKSTTPTTCNVVYVEATPPAAPTVTVTASPDC